MVTLGFVYWWIVTIFTVIGFFALTKQYVYNKDYNSMRSQIIGTTLSIPLFVFTYLYFLEKAHS